MCIRNNWNYVYVVFRQIMGKGKEQATMENPMQEFSSRYYILIVLYIDLCTFLCIAKQHEVQDFLFVTVECGIMCLMNCFIQIYDLLSNDELGKCEL